MINVKSNIVLHSIMRTIIFTTLLVLFLMSTSNATSTAVWSYADGAWYDIYGYDGYRFYLTPTGNIKNNTGFIGSYQEIEMQTDDGYYELVLVYYINGNLKSNLVKDKRYSQTSLVKITYGQTYVFTVMCENNLRKFVLEDIDGNILWEHTSQMTTAKCVKDLASSKGYPLRASSEIFWYSTQITDLTQWEISVSFTLKEVYDGTSKTWVAPTGVKTSGGIKQYIDGKNTTYRGVNVVYSNGPTLTTYSKFPDPTLPKAQITLSDVQGYAIVAALGGSTAIAYIILRRGW